MDNLNLLKKQLSRSNLSKLCRLFLMLVTALVIILIIISMFVNIYPGEAGVLWKRFDGGTQTDTVYSEGLHIISPFNRMLVYKINEQQKTLHAYRFPFGMSSLAAGGVCTNQGSHKSSEFVARAKKTIKCQDRAITSSFTLFSAFVHHFPCPFWLFGSFQHS